jgi:hypothetical protein
MTGIENVGMGVKFADAREGLCCGTIILRNTNSAYGVKISLGRKSQTGGRKSRNKEDSGTNLRKARLSSCYCESLATTGLRQSKPNQNYPLNSIDTRQGAHPTETEKVIRVILGYPGC